MVFHKNLKEYSDIPATDGTFPLPTWSFRETSITGKIRGKAVYSTQVMIILSLGHVAGYVVLEIAARKPQSVIFLVP